jgi:hypothetical protein
MTPSGIEAATFRLVPLCLNRLRHRVPLIEELLPAVTQPKQQAQDQQKVHNVY